MIYIVDTHVFIWYLDRNERLKPFYHQILTDVHNNFVFFTIVLAEIKHLISHKRINVDYEQVVTFLSESENCVIYPIDEDVVGEMPVGLDIHDALIVATGLVYRNILKEEVKILTEDKEIKQSCFLQIA
ncbi:MAG: type II toxin-antitoxin system VapC family toxin [Deltaproteobacteria bacterium]|nr:type II toxin-antitoxin system VapC family toxin [Deltaproteobacteria bacterium]